MIEGEFDPEKIWERLEYGSPSHSTKGNEVIRWQCAYCVAGIYCRASELKVCNIEECLRAAINDRLFACEAFNDKLSDTQIELQIEINELNERVAELRISNPGSLTLKQYEAVLDSAIRNLNYRVESGIDRRIFEFKEQIRELTKRIRRPQFSFEFRRELWLRDGKQCYICRKAIESCTGDVMHVEHVIPRSKGGSDEMSNLKAAHAICNLRKGSKELSDRKYAYVLKELRKSEEERQKERLF